MRKEPLTELGENYEYIKTIINNKIEIFKLDAIQTGSKFLGYASLVLFLSSFITIILGLISWLIVVLLAEYLDSLALGLMSTIIVWIVVLVGAFLLRKRLFYKPLSNFIWKKINDDDN